METKRNRKFYVVLVGELFLGTALILSEMTEYAYIMGGLIAGYCGFNVMQKNKENE